MIGIKVTLDYEGMFWPLYWCALNFSAIYTVSQIFSEEGKKMADYENINLVRKGKAELQTERTPNFVKEYSVFVGRRISYHNFLVKSYLCSM